MDELRPRGSGDYASLMQANVRRVEETRRQALEIRQKIPLPTAVPSAPEWQRAFDELTPLATALAQKVAPAIKNSYDSQRPSAYATILEWAQRVADAAASGDRAELTKLGMIWDVQVSYSLIAYLRRCEVLVPPEARTRSTLREPPFWTPTLFHAQKVNAVSKLVPTPN